MSDLNGRCQICKTTGKKKKVEKKKKTKKLKSSQPASARTQTQPPPLGAAMSRAKPRADFKKQDFTKLFDNVENALLPSCPTLPYPTLLYPTLPYVHVTSDKARLSRKAYPPHPPSSWVDKPDKPAQTESNDTQLNTLPTHRHHPVETTPKKWYQTYSGPGNKREP